MNSSRAGVLRVVFGCVALSALAMSVTALAGWSSAHSWMGRSRTVVPAAPLTSGELVSALLRTGLSPECLAAAGVRGPQAAALVSTARTHLADTIEMLRDADAGVTSAAAAVSRLERLVVSGLASPEELNALATARSSLTSARSTQSTRLGALRTAAEGELSTNQKNVLAAIRETPGEPSLPIPYRAASRTEAEAVALRDALANERINARAGQSPDAPAAAVLAAEHGKEAVAAARVNFDTHLAAVKAVWTSALGG